jgi:FkbM family methyltransferase
MAVGERRCRTADYPMKAAALLQMLTLRGHTFLPSPLGPSSTVVDLGAHRGEFARLIRCRFGCRVIAVEANPRFVADVQAVPGVEAHECAVCGRDGDLTFHLSDNPEAGAIMVGSFASGDSTTVHGRPLKGLLREAHVDRIDLLKMDIEGAEVEVFESLADDDLRRIDQITMEFHDFCGLVKPEEIAHVCNRLARVGFDGMRFGNDGRFGNMNWLFVRRGVPGAGAVRRAYVKHVVRRARRLLHSVRGRTGVRVGLSNE